MAEELFFTGGAAEAVSLSKSQRKPLVVFLKGTDAASAEVEAALVSPVVSDDVLGGAIVLRLDDDLEDPDGASADAKMFRSIPAYQTDQLPTVGLIGTNGAPLVWLKGQSVAEELVAKLKAGREEFGKQVQAELAMAAFATMMAQGGQGGMPAQAPPLATTPARPPPPPGGAEPQPRGAPPPAEPPPTLRVPPSPEEVAAAARDAGRRAEERMAQAVEEEKQRRERQLALERQRAEEMEKEEARQAELAKQRIEEEKQRRARAEERRKEQAVEASRAAAAAAEAQGVAHLAFRLLNGETIKGTFDIAAPLSEAAAWVDANRTDGARAYTLAVPFPKRVLAPEDMGRSLRELGLAPRAALVLQAAAGGPGGGAGISSAPGGEGAQPQGRTWGQFLGGTVGGVARTVGSALSYVNPLSYGGGPQYAADPAREAQIRAQQQAAGAGAGPSSSAGGSAKRKAGGGAGWGGNVATLRHDEDDDREDDRNKFWNGNSTQFGGDDK